MTQTARGFVLWGAAPVRTGGIALSLGSAALVLVFGIASRSLLGVLLIPCSVFFVVAAVEGIRWSSTWVRVTSDTVSVKNVGHRLDVDRSQVVAVVWAAVPLSKTQVLARWQRSGVAGHLVLDDGRRIALDCTRSAVSVLKTALPLPSLGSGRARSTEVASVLGVDLLDEAGPDPRSWYDVAR